MRRLRDVKLVDHLYGNIPHRTPFRVHQHIGLAVIWLTNCQQASDFCQWVGFIEQWPMIVPTDPLEDGFRRRPEADHQRMGLQACQVFFLYGKTSAGRDHRFAAVRQFLNYPLLVGAESRFALLLEDLCDGFGSPRLNDTVRVQISEVQKIRDQPSDRGFAGAHETNERQILNRAGVGHTFE